MDEFFDFIPGGRLTVAALGLLAIPGVRRQLRPVAKAAIRTGLTVTDQVKTIVAEAREQTSDLVAEARAEREEQMQQQQHPEGAKASETPSQPRARGAAPQPAATA